MTKNCPYSTIVTIIGTVRPAFLLLTAVCVFLGYALATYEGCAVTILHLSMVAIGALAAHAGVNALNEYFDFRSGLDFKTKRTPFSGGSGSLQRNPDAAPVVLTLGIIAVAIVFGIGVYFLILRGGILLISFVPGILAVLLYTPILVRIPFLCLIAPGIGFGIAMVSGTVIALTGTLSHRALVISLIPFFLVNNLLLLNQFPDIEPDRQFSRKNVVIVYGVRVGIVIYMLFMLCAIMVILCAILGHLLPRVTAIAIIPISVALQMVPEMRNLFPNNRLIQLLRFNTLIALVTPCIVGAALFII